MCKVRVLGVLPCGCRRVYATVHVGANLRCQSPLFEAGPLVHSCVHHILLLELQTSLLCPASFKFQGYIKQLVHGAIFPAPILHVYVSIYNIWKLSIVLAVGRDDGGHLFSLSFFFETGFCSVVPSYSSSSCLYLPSPVIAALSHSVWNFRLASNSLGLLLHNPNCLQFTL